MITIARTYLVLSAAAQLVLGIMGLAAIDRITGIFHLQPQSAQGLSEIRAWYGGANVAWALITFGALLHKPLARGLLAALASMLGFIALTRVVSMAIDHELASNLPSFITEGLVVAACWILFRSESVIATP